MDFCMRHFPQEHLSETYGFDRPHLGNGRVDSAMRPGVRARRLCLLNWLIRWRFVSSVVLVLWLAAGFSSVAYGQSLWEVSPYRIAVWISLSDHPRIPSNWNAELERQLEKQSASLVGAGWQMNAQSTPVLFRADLLAERIPEWQTLVEAVPELRQFDKLLTLNIQAAADGYALQARELDLQTQAWSLSSTRSVGSLSQVPSAAFVLLCDVFAPLVRIVRVGDETVTAAVRRRIASPQ